MYKIICKKTKNYYNQPFQDMNGDIFKEGECYECVDTDNEIFCVNTGLIINGYPWGEYFVSDDRPLKEKFTDFFYTLEETLNIERWKKLNKILENKL